MMETGDPLLEPHVFGRRLKARRIFMGISAEELAEAVAKQGEPMTVNMIWAFERGVRFPSIPQIAVIMKVLEVPFEYFEEEP